VCHSLFSGYVIMSAISRSVLDRPFMTYKDIAIGALVSVRVCVWLRVSTFVIPLTRV